MKKLNLVLLALLTPSSLVFATRDWKELTVAAAGGAVVGGVVTYVGIVTKLKHDAKKRDEWAAKNKQQEGQLGQKTSQQ